MSRTKKKNDVVWFGSAGGLMASGPYSSQIEVYQAFRLTENARESQRKRTGSGSPYPIDLVVWCETTQMQRRG